MEGTRKAKKIACFLAVSWLSGESGGFDPSVLLEPSVDDTLPIGPFPSR